MTQQFNRLLEVVETLAGEQVGIDHLRVIHWKRGAYCTHCGSTKVYNRADRKTHKCCDCRRPLPLKIGPIFKDTKLVDKKRAIVVSAFVLLHLCAGEALAQSVPVGQDIQTLSDVCQYPSSEAHNLCVQFIYSAGRVMVVNALALSRIPSSDREAKSWLAASGICDGDKVPSGAEMTEAFLDWVPKHPELLRDDATEGVIEALSARWPCDH